MALIVETGSGVVGATSYISVADATAYFAARGVASWASLASDAVREQLLVKATDFMEQIYRLRWKGYRVSSTQALSWPRANVQISDGPYGTIIALSVVPIEVKNACAELALRAATQVLAPDLGRGKTSVTVGPLKVDYDRMDSQQKRFLAVDRMLSAYLGGSSVNARVIAA